MKTFGSRDRYRSVRLVSMLLVLALSAPITQAGKPSGKPPSTQKASGLSIDFIMRGPELVGYEPRAVRWSGDNQHIYFQWKQASDPHDKDYDTYVVAADGSGLKKLTEEEARNAPPLDADTTRDKKLAVYVQNGDVFVYDRASGQRRQITSTTDAEQDTHFNRDQRHVYFTRSNNLFVMSLDSGSLVQMTDIRTGGAAAPTLVAGRGGRGASATGSEEKGTDSQEFVKKEERDLLDIIKERAAHREEEEAKRKKENPRKPFTLQARQTVRGLQLSPDEKYVIATVNESDGRAKNTIVPNYVTESGYTEDIPGRTKVGDDQAPDRLAIIDVATGDVKWVDHGQKQPAADRKIQGGGDENTPPAPAAEGANRQDSGAAPRPRPQPERPVQLSRPLWSEDGTKAVLMARATDNKDRWILALDPTTGKTRVLASDHDDAWLDGPGAFTLGWMPGDQGIYFQSERSGYSHLYTVAYSGGDPTALTSGKWEVSSVQLSDDKKRFYLATSKVGPGERHLYVMPSTGGEMVQITSMAGGNQSFISPDEQKVAIIYSYSNKPPELYIQPNRPGATAVKVTTSPTLDFASRKWLDPPIINFKASDGETVYGRLYKPDGINAGAPAVIFVHGAGYLQNVHRFWSSYFREYMFHHFLMEHGYVVLDIDYRGSAGYGRDWRTGIYRHMGGKDLDDEVDAAHWLASTQGVDPKRIGLYGGSYGGFITLMAMFTKPDVFAAGAALRPVTDWAHYNHGYTSAILNVPQKDQEAYRQSSPIYFASGLKGALLICHGMADTNVHFQDTVRLVQRLIELHKDNWDLAVYPVENHGFEEPSSWADEYKRIFRLFETNLKASATKAAKH